ncbi:hypothetical protein S40288_00931 [Stachybotrys chartarum IBT 40288]|nr:hypothetical protein S40288_00931 [Stachybotrys chartarum IBT 40288]
MGSSLSSIGGNPQRRIPRTVETDEVVPVHPFDNLQALRDLTLIWTYRFEDVLDADLLGASLAQLFQMKGWRRLGGRLRRRNKSDGKFEIHVPREFTAARPSLHFTKEAFNFPIAEHPEASSLPECNGVPQTFPSARSYASLALGPGAPKRFEDYFSTDIPLFALHVVTFTDGTLVSINFNHTTSDLGGLEAVLKGWQCILAGQPEKVPEFPGYRKDPMEPLYSPTGPIAAPIMTTRMSGLKLAAWALRTVVEQWWAPLDSRMLCIPRSVADALVAETKREVSTGELINGEKPFVSEGDVMVALFNRMMARGQPVKRTIVNFMIIDARGRAKSVFSKDKAYVQNSFCAAFFLAPPNVIVGKPLGHVALQSRISIATQATEANIQALMTDAHTEAARNGHVAVLGNTSTTLMVTSNWSKARFRETMDLSAAVVKPAKTEGRKAKLGHPVYYHSQSLEPAIFATTMGYILGRDLDGNMWLSGDFPTEAWEDVVEYLNTYR